MPCVKQSIQRRLRSGGFWLAALLCAMAAPVAQAAPTVSIALTQPITLQDDRGRSLTLSAPAQRLISLVPSLTETVCALGHCATLVGVDRFSNWPTEVKRLPQLGGLEDTQVERIVSLKPDLVLAAKSSRAVDRLEALGLRVLTLEPQNLRDTERVLRTVGLALGDAPAADQLWQRIQARVSAAQQSVPVALRGQRVYFEVAAAPFAAGEASFVGDIVQRLGLANIVPAALGPFPQLNPEFVVRAQPDIVMATRRALADMPARPGWSGLRALRDGRSCGFDAAQWDTLVRPGPRLADAAEALAECLQGLQKLPLGAAQHVAKPMSARD